MHRPGDGESKRERTLGPHRNPGSWAGREGCKAFREIVLDAAKPLTPSHKRLAQFLRSLGKHGLEAVLKAVFAKRAEELRKALVRGREWLGGVKDDLAERLAALATCPTARVSVWAERPLPLALSISRTVHQAEQVGVELPEREDERQHEPVITLPAATSPVLAALPPLLPEEATTTPPVVPLQEPTWEPVITVGSRAEVVFGRSEHIALARVRSRARRPGGYRETPRRRIPVSERDIPSLIEDEVAGADEQCHQVLMPSLWDQLVAPTSQASTATLFAVSSHDQHAPLQ